MSALLAFLVVAQTPVLLRADQLLTYAQTSIGSGNRPKVEGLFQRKEDAAYLFEMAQSRGGLRGIQVSILPSPPGWEDTGAYWAVFHTRQDIESDHDPVYAVLRTDSGLKLGQELPEWAGIDSRIQHMSVDVRLMPEQSRAKISALVQMDGQPAKRATIFRLNDFYRPTAAEVDNKAAEVLDANDRVPEPKPGQIVRAGSLLIPWVASSVKRLRVSYEGQLDSADEDKINNKQVYLTAWWTPSVGRLPFTCRSRITGPKSFVLRGEGNEVKDVAELGPIETSAGEQTVAFDCQIPISYPKVIGGKYTLAAEATIDGRRFRSYQLEPVERDRGMKEVQAIGAAAAFYDRTLGKFPFDHYDCFDATGYYGIESYSHTLLQKGITLRFISHEMGHTYFGGLVPSAYTRDAWNESLTQYIDSIVYQNNNDRTLEMGLQTIGIDLPLAKMAIAHQFDSATYYRGAYVMRMLEDEIGREKVLAGLRDLIKDRVGKETTWPILMPYFERASGQKLDWFWKQWVSNAKFPILTVQSFESNPVNRKWRTRVTVTQSGTPDPFRLRFAVRVRKGNLTSQLVAPMRSPSGTFSVESDFRPDSAEVVAFPFTLAGIENSRGRTKP